MEGGRLYRTGDRARFLANGDIEYLGRLDHQVKIRGFRVELGEIEAALGSHPALRTSTVITQHDPAAGTRLLAYIVGTGAARPTNNQIREYLGRRLPDHMVPAVFIWLDRLPLTENGKVDRRALPAPDDQRPDISSTFVAPGTPAEKTLAEIWREVLVLDRVGAHDNFFELGGNSLLAVQMLARLRTAGHAGLEIADLFQFPTVQSLAARLERFDHLVLDEVRRRAQRQAASLRSLAAAPTS